MESLNDAHGPERRLWLRLIQSQSDFEKTLAFRLTLLAAVVVISINVFAPDSQPGATPTATHAAVRATA